MIAELAPVRLREALTVARTSNASDVHLQAGFPPVMRIDGALTRAAASDVRDEELKALAEMLVHDRQRAVLSQHGDVTVTFRDEAAGTVRIHLYRTVSGLALAIRLLAIGVPNIDSLDFPPAVSNLSELTAGLVIFSGPTGSGKSTALAALVDRINRTSARHIVTIEDPIEYRHADLRSLISQRQVDDDVPSFAQAVHGALRCDPDVILIGEMRDAATMRAALTAAETGHLVLTTLHTGEAAQTVERIIGAFGGEEQPELRLQLAHTLQAVVCMRLVPRASGNGRCPALELLLANDAVRALIRDGKTHHLRNVITTSRQSGMQTLEAHLSDLVSARKITLSQAQRAAFRPGEVQ